MWEELKNKIQLDATYYFIILMLGSTCFGHHYAHHQELTTIALVTTQAVCPDRMLCYSLQSGHPSIPPALNFQPAATPEPDGLCGNQHYGRELLMMDIMVSETC